MFLIDDKEQLLKFIMDTYNAFKQKFPGKYDNILTEQRAKAIVDNNQKLEKFKKIYQARQQLSQNEAKMDELKIELPQDLPNCNRIISTNLSTENTREAFINNMMLKNDAQTASGIKDNADKMLNKLLDLPILDVNVENYDEVVNFYSEHAKDLEAGTVFSSVYVTDGKKLGYTDEQMKFFEDNKLLFESAGQIRTIVDLNTNIFSLILDDAEIDNEDLTEMSTDIDEILEEHATKGYEDFKYGNQIGTQYSAMLTCKQRMEYEKEEYKNKKKLYGDSHTFRDIVENHKYKDANGNEITANDAFRQIDSVTSEKTTEQEKEAVQNNLKSIAPKKSLYDPGMEEERLNIATELFNKFSAAYPNVKLELKDFTKNLNDESIENHKKAVELKKASVAKNLMVDTLQTTKLDSGIARSVYLAMDASGTQEANEHNKQVIEKVETLNGSREFINKEIKNLTNLHISQYLYDKDSQYLDNYEKDIKDIGQGFVVQSMLDNTSWDKSGAIKNYVRSTKTIAESLGVLDNVVDYNASPFNTICPIDIYNLGLDDPKKNKEIFESVLGPGLNKYSDFAEYQKLYNPDNNTTAIANQSYAHLLAYDMQKDSAKILKEMIDKKIFTDNPQKDNYIIEKSTGKQVSLKTYVDAYKSNKKEEMDKYEVKEYSKGQKAIIDEVVESPLTENSVQKVFKNKDKVLAAMNNILNAKAKIKFFDSDEYNKLCQDINELKPEFENGILSSQENVDSLNVVKFQSTLSKIKNVVRSANKYQHEKENQRKNRTRQTRYDNAIELSSLLDEPENSELNKDLKENKSILEIDRQRVPERIQMEVKEAEEKDALNEGFYLDEGESLELDDELEMK